MKVQSITYESVKERLKNKPIEEWSKQDVFDRYIAYSDDNELRNPDIQKLLIQHGYIDELTSIISSVITDNEVIEKILSSDFVKNENIILKNGKIKKISFEEDWMYIEFIDENNTVITVKDVHFKSELKDSYEELNKYKDKELTLIIDNTENEMRLRCALKKNEENLERVELHVHTKMSQMDGIASCKEYIEKAKQSGITSIAITDHRNSTIISTSTKIFRRYK